MALGKRGFARHFAARKEARMIRLLPLVAAAPLALVLAACSPAKGDDFAGSASVAGAEAIAPGYHVRGQIAVADLSTFASAGYKLVINNRPDGEEAGQPSSATLESESRKLGLRYVHIPVAKSGPTEADARQLAAVLKANPGPVLAFCRSGKRAANLKAMADSLQ
jgi:sulfide:quinone oxidoreductase